MGILKDWPTSGKVVVSHPDIKKDALQYADQLGLDVVLDEECPPTHYYIDDIDKQPPSLDSKWQKI